MAELEGGSYVNASLYFSLGRRPDGKGYGPLANKLQVQPTALALLQSNNNGKFPDLHVLTVLRSGSDTSVHGSCEMPAWEKVFDEMNGSDQIEADARISNLCSYLKTIQVR